MTPSKQHKRLMDVNVKPVEAIESYFIDGKLYVSKKFLSKFYNVNEMTINKWEKEKGFKRSSKGFSKLILYDFDYTLKFREEMVSSSKKQSAIRDNKDIPIRNADEEDAVYAKVELKKKQNEVILQEIKIKEAKGNLVPADTTDKAIAEFGAYFVGFLRNSRTTLSRDLEGMTQDERYAFLDLHFGEFVNDVAKRVNHEQPEDLATIYDEIHRRINLDD